MAGLQHFLLAGCRIASMRVYTNIAKGSRSILSEKKHLWKYAVMHNETVLCFFINDYFVLSLIAVECRIDFPPRKISPMRCGLAPKLFDHLLSSDCQCITATNVHCGISRYVRGAVYETYAGDYKFL